MLKNTLMKIDRFLPFLIMCLLFVASLTFLVYSFSATNDQLYSTTEHKVSNNIFLQPKLSYTPHAPILIDGDADFITQSSANGWDLSGSRDGSSVANAFVIQGLSISDPTGLQNLIEIRNSDLFFEITNCKLVNGSIGILLYNTANGIVSTNYIGNNSVDGITFNNGVNINVSDNSLIYNQVNAVHMYNVSSNLNIINNSIDFNTLGALVVNSHHNTLSGNIFNETNSYAIKFTDTTSNNQFLCNIVLNAEPGTSSYGYDDGSHNDIGNNYWPNWSGSGNYLIDGSSSNADHHPYSTPNDITPGCVFTPTTSPGFESYVTLFFLATCGALIVYRRKSTD